MILFIFLASTLSLNLSRRAHSYKHMNGRCLLRRFAVYTNKNKNNAHSSHQCCQFGGFNPKLWICVSKWGVFFWFGYPGIFWGLKFGGCVTKQYIMTKQKLMQVIPTNASTYYFTAIHFKTFSTQHDIFII